MAQVFTIRVLYANGYTHDFDVLEFKITDGGEWSWVDANPHVKPLKLGIKHIIALFQLGVKEQPDPDPTERPLTLGDK